MVVLYLVFTDPTYIIGAGANGNAALHRIPPDACTIALNGAHINRKWSARLFYDCNCYRYNYYYLAKEWLVGVRSTIDNRFHYCLTLELAWGCTGAGYAIKWLAAEGVNNIVLCGVDMYGGHWDGTLSGQEGVWAQLPKLQQLIAETPVNVYTISDSMLEIPQWHIT